MRLVALAALAACSGSESRPMEAVPVAPTPPDAAAATTEPASTSSTSWKGHALITDPKVLSQVTQVAYDRILDDATRALIAKTVAADVAAAGAGDPEAGVGIAGNSHRLFDVGWLAKGSFELIAIAYRVDRIPMTPGTCGDLRLIYRLAYRATTAGVEVTSRLPMTVAIVLDGPQRAPSADDAVGCRTAVSERRIDATPGRVRQILTNTQVVRWPSAARPDLAGHAEYALRVFERSGDRFTVAKADHTPDAARLVRDPALKAKLLAWLREPANLDAIDRGWIDLPDEFAAPRAISVSPRGFARRANRPWRQVFAPKELAELPLAGRTTIGSPSALLRRLDEQTCNGCHQAQTIAGFHLLGEDGPGVAPGNAMLTALSPPLVAEQRRREALIDALAKGEQVELARPSFERTGNAGGRGARCGLGDPGFAAWTCEAGLTCQPTDAPRDDADVGECLPAADARGFGDPCELGPLVPNANPRRDHGPRATPGSCAAGACNTNRVGFPGGMCAGSCDDLPANATCGVIAVLTPFNHCLAQNRPFPQCIADHVRPAGLRACDASRPCRDDYVCARTPTGTGGCMPPYFLFQLRVDGHPSSKHALPPR